MFSTMVSSNLSPHAYFLIFRVSQTSPGSFYMLSTIPAVTLAWDGYGL